MDNSFRAYCAQSPTMKTVASNRRLWKINLVMFASAILTCFS